MNSIDATLRQPKEKIPIVQTIRRDTETLKHLVRMECEIKIINEKTYLHQIRLIEDVSMMATGWQKSLLQKIRQ